MLARQIVVGLCVAFILPLVVYTGVNLFHPEPKLPSYFMPPPPLPANATADERRAAFAKQSSDRQVRQAAYDEAQKAFAFALIMVAVPIGLVAVSAASLIRLHSIGAGLIAGGVLSVTLGYRTDWQYIDPLLRFILLLGAFVILLVIGFRQQGRSGAS
jgi:hypothetical protein